LSSIGVSKHPGKQRLQPRVDRLTNEPPAATYSGNVDAALIGLTLP
jgi:hypothetical protein